MSYLEYIVHKDAVAVITGAASGIGLAAAKHFASKSMKVMMADINEPLLTESAKAVKAVPGANEVESMKVDVSKMEDVVAMKERVMELWGEVSVLMNNAASFVNAPTFSLTKSPQDIVQDWHNSFDVSVFGVLHGTAVFAPIMASQENRSIIINTGSKQGISCPPGNSVYNAGKSTVKSLTEALAHELRNTPGSQCSAHLLVPGWVFTGERSRSGEPKPIGAWSPEQTVQYMLDKLSTGSFYVICPDNDVTTELDNLRFTWAMQDVTQDRPALSRWHPEYKALFDEYVRRGLGLKSRSVSRGRPGANMTIEE